MSSFQKQLAFPLARRSRTGSSRPSASSPAPVSAVSPTPQQQQVDTSAAGPSHGHDKRKRAAEFDPTNPPAVNPERIMATTKGVAREAQAKHVGLEKRMKIAASQLCVLEGYTPDPEFMEVIKRLPEYLQLVVTLMGTMVPSTEESKMRQKKGREALSQATSMVLMVSTLFHSYSHQVSAGRSSNYASFPFLRVS